MVKYTLARTKSLSPLSCNEIEARVFRVGDKVYLIKKDEEGKSYKVILEKDYAFYKLMTRDKFTAQISPIIIDLYVSSRCNLNCPVCYEDKSDVKEPSLDEIKMLLKNFRNKRISLMGREPTCREDLFQIIRLANKRNIARLITNGIKLSDYEYALRLKDSGLKHIFFSFNGFSDDIYQKLNGRPLLDLKLKALENIKKLGIETILSLTLTRGINENQIRKLCEFCLDNRSFISEFRIRTITSVGRHLDVEPYCMSELIDLVAAALSIDKEDILNEHLFLHEITEELKFIMPLRIRNYLCSRLCSFIFNIKRKNTLFPLGREIDIKKIKRTKFKIFLLIYYLFKIYGIRFIFEKFCLNFKLPIILKNKDILPVVFRCWPNSYNIDLEENKKCPTLYYKNGKLLPFCYYNIIGSKSHF